MKRNAISDALKDVMVEFDKVSAKPEKLLDSDNKLKGNLEHLLKLTYDLTKKEESAGLPTSNALPELIVDGFDIEQIWQQLELQNAEYFDGAVGDVSRLVAVKDGLRLDVEESDGSGSDADEDGGGERLEPKGSESDAEGGGGEESEESGLEDPDSDDDDGEGETIAEEDVSRRRRQIKNKSVVDDDFFKLEEMNKFLIDQERPAAKKTKKGDDEDESDSEESVNLFDDESEHDSLEDTEGNPKYGDFFQTEKESATAERKRREKESDEDVEQDGDGEKDQEKSNSKSSHEMRAERLRKRIEVIEGEKLDPKPWQMKGEVTGEGRPENSLLQEVVEFDLINRPAPVITEEVNRVVEDVILQRIKDRAFDDVVRKQKSVEAPLEYKKKLLLDQEKSKQSLAQIYENDYLQQVTAQGSQEEREEEEPKLHVEIRTEMQALFAKLDALSNFHFTPKMATADVRIVSNMPAIGMEEVAPLATSDAAMLAPEEVRNREKGDTIGKGEMTGTDKKRSRRKKKRKQQVHAQKLQKSPKAAPNPKHEKAKAKVKGQQPVVPKSIKSSTAFFTQLQDEVKSQIKSKKAKRVENNAAHKATKIML